MESSETQRRQCVTLSPRCFGRDKTVGTEGRPVVAKGSWGKGSATEGTRGLLGGELACGCVESFSNSGVSERYILPCAKVLS